MKPSLITALVIVALLLSACVSDSSTNIDSAASVAAPNTVSVLPTTLDTIGDDDTLPIPQTPIVEPPAETPITPIEEQAPAAQAEVLPWLRIPMHYEILLGQPHIWNEAEETLTLRLATSALTGSTSLELNSTESLVPQQLISYYANDGEYYSAQIQSIENKTLLLATPLKQTISAGANAWNFYSNGSHPNEMGYHVIADYAVRLLGKDRLNQGVHVLFGDSWFDDGSIHQRLQQHLPSASIINRGIGGNTSIDLLARFDEAISPHNPNFVWILTGTNDYWQGVDVATYKNNMGLLISNVIAAGAVPIVFDSSVGPLNFGTDTITTLSQSYVTALEQLLAEAN